MLFATLAHVSGQLVCEGLEIVGQKTAQPTCHEPAGLLLLCGARLDSQGLLYRSWQQDTLPVLLSQQEDSEGVILIQSGRAFR